jgi:dTDP-3-amino-3,4,6-trideoxy-alpha-D-glucose transaminase
VVPVVDLSRRGSQLATRFAETAERIATSGSYLLGEELARFERELAGWLGAQHAVGVSSGASALQLALTAAGIGPGDEVLVPAFTAVPTASAVVACGARPIAVDVDLDTACLTPETIAGRRGALTRAVIVVHLYGLPAELPVVDDDLIVIDDAAQSLGALSRPTPAAATIYSFYPTKNLGGIGDGGAVVTDDPAIAGRVAMLRAHGMTAQYVHEAVSQNFRMSELEAAWLRLGLESLESGNARRRQIAATYREAAPHLQWQRHDDRHAYHLCVIRAADRDRVRRALAEQGIATAVHYPLALNQQPAYRELFPDACPNAERWAAECITLPCFPELTDGEIDQVATALQGVR